MRRPSILFFFSPLFSFFHHSFFFLMFHLLLLSEFFPLSFFSFFPKTLLFRRQVMVFNSHPSSCPACRELPLTCRAFSSAAVRLNKVLQITIAGRLLSRHCHRRATSTPLRRHIRALCCLEVQSMPAGKPTGTGGRGTTKRSVVPGPRKKGDPGPVVA